MDYFERIFVTRSASEFFCVRCPGQNPASPDPTERYYRASNRPTARAHYERKHSEEAPSYVMKGPHQILYCRVAEELQKGKVEEEVHTLGAIVRALQGQHSLCLERPSHAPDSASLIASATRQGLRVLEWEGSLTLMKPTERQQPLDFLTRTLLQRYCVGALHDQRRIARDILAHFGVHGKKQALAYLGLLARVRECRLMLRAEVLGDHLPLRRLHPFLTDEFVNSLYGTEAFSPSPLRNPSTTEPIDVDAFMGEEIEKNGVPHPDNHISASSSRPSASSPYDYCFERDFHTILTSGQVIERAGQLIAVFLKNAVPEPLRSAAANVLRAAAVKTTARILTNGGVPPDSGIVGYYDYFTTPATEKCRKTAYTRLNESLLEDSKPLFTHLHQLYEKSAPRQFALQNRAIPEDVRFFNTCFSTVTVNSKFRTALHTDSGDFKSGLAVLTVLEGNYDGLMLGLKSLGIAADVRPGDVLMFNTDLLHGNTELRGVWKTWSRLSLVCYLRVNLYSPKCMETFATRRTSVRGMPSSHSPQPSSKNVLQPHQEQALHFVSRRVSLDTGALVCLDMGMGKTLVVLTLCHNLLQIDPQRTILVLCPFSLLSHWRLEFIKWSRARAIQFTIHVLEKEAEEQEIVRKWSLTQKGVLVCGYERFSTLINRRSDESFRVALSRLYACILDEGHRLRSMQTFTAQDLYSITTHRRVVLSGTPLQNNLSELYVLIRWVDPYAVPPEPIFAEDFEGPMRFLCDPSATITQRRSAVHALYLFQTRFLHPLSIRMTSTSLPPKHDYVVLLIPTANQREILPYITGKSLVDVQDCVKLALHPLLLLARAKSLVFEGHKWKKYVEDILHKAQSKEPGSVPQLREDSSKLAFLHGVVEEAMRHGERVLVFSQYRFALDIAEISLQQCGIDVLRVDGTTSATQREQTLAEFHNESLSRPVLLLSIKTLGVGVNLAVASRVVILEPTYNPTMEAQAVARAHRFGQRRPVHVYRLLFDETRDDHVFQFQVEKHALCQSVFKGGQGGVKAFSYFSEIDAGALRDGVLKKCVEELKIVKGIVPHVEVVDVSFAMSARKGTDSAMNGKNRNHIFLSEEEVRQIEAEYAHKCIARLSKGS